MLRRLLACGSSSLRKLAACVHFCIQERDSDMAAEQLPKLMSRNQTALGGAQMALLVLLAVVLACSSGSAPKCSATLTYEGRTYTGADATLEKATSNACNK